MHPTRYISAICIVFLVLQLGFVFVMAASVGVKPGHWAKYTMLGAQPSYISMKISISRVSGTTVYGNMTYEYPGGSMEIASFQGDVLNGEMFPYIVPANLNEGDYIYYNSEYSNLEVQNVTTRSYAGASRTIICATEYGWQTYYWDQQTGILVEETYSSGSMVSSMLKLTETNIWGGGIFGMNGSLSWILPIVIVVIVAVVLLVIVLPFLRRMKTPKETVTPPSTTPPPTAPSSPPKEESRKTKYCPKCGTSVPLDSIYCPKCGHKQHQT